MCAIKQYGYKIGMFMSIVEKGVFAYQKGSLGPSARTLEKNTVRTKQPHFKRQPLHVDAAESPQAPLLS